MVASVVHLTESKKQIQQTARIFEDQRQAFRRNPYPTEVERRENLRRLKRLLLTHQDRLIEAIDQDFSCRSADETRIAELMPSVQGINYALKHLRGWMKPSRRHVTSLFQPASNQVQYQPKGVAGIIVPWNYPLFLAIGPLTAALAAGNRVMIKMSEFTPHTSALFSELIESAFPQDLVAVINGEADVAADFSSRPFDHILFTGSTAVGHHVMRAAAENLTPVTLELGGKSPAIISSDVPMDDAAERIAFGKVFNAGQTCVAPDYVLVPADRRQSFIDTFRDRIATMFPTLRDNTDYTSIINERQYQRLQSVLEDAREKGAEVIEVNPGSENLTDGTRKMSPHLVLGGTDDMLVMQDELFGPILPVVTYGSIDEAIDYINDRPRPLALYYFGYDREAQDHVAKHTISGGMAVNDTLMQVTQDDLPFGGVGQSGMGAYHGREGFETFSHARGVFSRQKLNSGKLIYPPYGSAFQRMVYRLFIR
ncbi:coniferyl-aldehyde dehydrogenase [Tamilnaduibacter salinus]|uniref:Aldehyde dehydrogenase n=1 Tax=Tamilnaduibacter salinus TaxID=1484056 RepID=A0A2A2I0W1_9GAMM|nr:coniferyl aldehyde dehydrogenase [Tamilnaduibacter salinus]PAV25661.1 coniferyl-aldehyde dehydrogenase [Tamilnaduibacter salinus]PVY76368.1 coniferyl-aldehyde dehydrogenase [Tamilnaduibacter salinus]